jgi:hypothetical protein
LADIGFFSVIFIGFDGKGEWWDFGDLTDVFHEDHLDILGV